MNAYPPVVAALGVALAAVACAGTVSRPAAVAPAAGATATVPADHSAAAVPREPLLAPQAARLLGLLPRRTVGAEQFLADYPERDGRGVVIGVLDSGIDAGVPGLRQTTTGEPKLLDLRDFSGEGHVPLTRLTPAGDAVTVEGSLILRGFGRVARLAVGPSYGGVLVERDLGALPAADVNGDGDRDDRLPLVVARATDGWFVMADVDGDGSLTDEQAVRDYGQAGETFTYGPLTLAANFSTGDDAPRLDLFFDTSGHGTHVAGIAAGHDLFGVPGFDGLAPGARVLGLKIANNARGGVSVSGSMLRAMEYAAAVAERRGLDLVLNLSYGIGNESGTDQAVLDSLIDAFALAHPAIQFVISVGNDGPGLSSVSFPGSAEFALSACALFPGVFAQAPNAPGPAAEDVLGWWSARGGARAKPDVCVPGVAYSNVPPWQTGEEVSGGTSMAAPQLAGVAALLRSALLAEGRRPPAADIAQAVRATATPLPGATTLDAGAGIPNVAAAYRWLRAGHRAGRFVVRALADGANAGLSAAYRRGGIALDDSIQHFTVAPQGGQPFARVLLRSDAPWLRTPATLDFAGAPAAVTLRYDAQALQTPGLHVGTVWARPATDTLGGAVFGFTNTVIVPHQLDETLRAHRYVARGRSTRLFLDVPDGAGGLSVRVAVADEEQAVSAYLFEPAGRPQRDEAVLEVGGQGPAVGEFQVRGEDLVTGVYEVVLVAPPTRSVTVEVEAAIPPLRIADLAAGAILLVNRTTRAVEPSVSIRPLGAGQHLTARGAGGGPRRVTLAVPSWARTLQLDVRFPAAVWRRVTDVGLAVWDTAGYLIAEAPLNYATTRQRLALEPAGARPIEIEIMPAFALPGDTTSWVAELTAVFLPGGIPAPATAMATSVGPADSIAVPWTLEGHEWLAEGLRRYVEVIAATPGAPAAMRRALLPEPTGSR